MSEDTRETTGRAPNAMAWAAATLVLTKGTTLVSILILARLLVPADFGLFAVGLLVINYIDRIKDVGVGAALIYRREDWGRLAPTGLSLSMVSAVMLAGLAYVCAPLTGLFFDDADTPEIVQALSLSILISGLAIVPESRMRRELDFRRRMLPETSAAVCKGVLSVMLAYAGYGVWSLVWAQLAGTVVQTMLYWALCRWRPRFEWHRDHVRVLLRYGLPSALVAVLAVVTENIDYLMIGRLMEPADLGYYVLAYRIPELSVIAVCLVAGQVFFPMFSRLQDDIASLRACYLDAVRYVSLITVPMGVLIAVVAPDVITTLYSDRWAPAIPLLRLLALFSVVYSMSFHAGEVYKATGRPGILNTLAVVKVLVMVPALWIGAQYGIVMVAMAVLLANVFLTGCKLAVVERILHIRSRQLVTVLLPSVVASVLMGGAVLALSMGLDGVASLWRLLVVCVAALPLYLAALRVVAPNTSREVWAFVRRSRRPVPEDGVA